LLLALRVGCVGVSILCLRDREPRAEIHENESDYEKLQLSLKSSCFYVSNGEVHFIHFDISPFSGNIVGLALGSGTERF
jgi:hypothetical protein